MLATTEALRERRLETGNLQQSGGQTQRRHSVETIHMEMALRIQLWVMLKLMRFNWFE